MNCCAGISKYLRHSEAVSATHYDFSQIKQSARNWAAVLDLVGRKKTVVAPFWSAYTAFVHKSCLIYQPTITLFCVRVQQVSKLLKYLSWGDMCTRLLHRYHLRELHSVKRYKSTTLAVYMSSLQHFYSFLRQQPQYLSGCLDDKAIR